MAIRIGFIILLNLLVYSCFGQTFSTNDTIVEISKMVDASTPPHASVQLNNFSGSDLDMRWIASFSEDYPVEWRTDITDPSQLYNEILEGDSADFILQEVVDFSDKMIIAVHPNGQTGSGTAFFKLFPIDNRNDSIVLEYHILIKGTPTVGLEKTTTDNEVNFYPNPCKSDLTLIGSTQNIKTLSIIDLFGKKVLSENKKKLDVSHLKTGSYFLEITYLNQSTVRKPFFKL